MKLSHTSRHPWSRLLATLVLLVGLCSSAFAQSDNTTGDGAASGPPPGPMFADEAIGTLPTYWTEQEFVYFPGPVGAVLMAIQKGQSFEAVVPVQLVKPLFKKASGLGFAFVGPTSPGMVRVRIFGAVELQLDTAVMAGAKIKTQIRYGIDYLFGQAQVFKNGQAGQPFTLLSTAGVVDLGLLPIAQGKLPLSGIGCRAWTLKDQQARVRVMLQSGVIRVLMSYS
jgi:hypothetical protein